VSWELFKKHPRTKRDSVPMVHINRSGISFTSAARTQWVRGSKFAEILIDRENFKLAVKFLDSPTSNAYKVCISGSRGPQAKLTCTKLFKALELLEPRGYAGTFDPEKSFLEIDLDQHRP
jgi:hypothetical protein